MEEKNSLEENTAVPGEQKGRYYNSLTLFSRASKDLRTTLSQIIGLAEIAQLDLDNPEKVKGYLEQIIVSGENLNKIIGDLLDLQDIEESGIVLHPEKMNMIELLEIVEAELSRIAEERGLYFSISIGSDVPREVIADRYRLEQVLVKMVENTFSYTGNGGTVKMAVAVSGHKKNQVRFEFLIVDNSIGVDTGYLSSIFEPPHGDSENDDIGLGLALAKRNLAAMGGKVEAASSEDGGTRVVIRLTLPVPAPRYTSYIKRAPIPQEEYHFAGGRILLVDDHMLSIEIGCKMLESAGFKVVTAMNGQEAVDAYIDNIGDFDLILMDIRMPVMDGLLAARAIRDSGIAGALEVPIVAMTASAFEEDIRRSYEAGMNNHLAKPFGPLDMYRVLVKYLERV